MHHLWTLPLRHFQPTDCPFTKGEQKHCFRCLRSNCLISLLPAFHYAQGHPVYNQPLPGVGWNNNSVFSFWGSPFDRPGGFVNKELAARAANWSQPDSGVVHMFHSGEKKLMGNIVAPRFLRHPLTDGENFFFYNCMNVLGLWGGWQYQLNGFDAANQAFTFGYGGFQEARGYGDEPCS